MVTTDTSTAEMILACLGNQMDYSEANRSMSPFYSDVGLGFVSDSGLARLYLHYNRRTTELGSPFFKIDQKLVRAEQTALKVAQFFDRGEAHFAFYGRNTWIIDCHDVGASFQFPAEIATRKTWMPHSGIKDLFLYRTYFPNKDPRDVDTEFPFLLGMRVITGKSMNDGLQQEMLLNPDDQGRLIVAFSAHCLDVNENKVIQELSQIPNVDDATASVKRWFSSALGIYHFVAEDENEKRVLSTAAFSLITNATQAPGYLDGRISAFPSRGRYPTHYLWDSCFTNLALEKMAPQLAEDAMLLLTENLRADGKMAHFLTSTWMRPHASQPPLVGWAGLRLVKLRNDKELARKLLYPLVKNTQWWMAYRMTEFGVLRCDEGLETGWDNTPRFDRGPTLACDINSYVLIQIRACEEMAIMIGDTNTEKQQHDLATKFAQRIVDVLYDPEDGLFKEYHIESQSLLPLKTPACFLPLLAGVPLGNDKIDNMITQHLLNPEEFFGAVPFPSVAYNEECYSAGNWWRGPTWMPVAYLMLDILEKYGYKKERKEAAKRLYDVIIKDGFVSELFNSQTGLGKGAKQQGWTAGIVIRLHDELYGV